MSKSDYVSLLFRDIAQTPPLICCKFRLNKNYGTSLRLSLKYFLLLAGDLFGGRNSAIIGEKHIFNHKKSFSTCTAKFIGIIRKQIFVCEFPAKKFINHFSDCYIYTYTITDMIFLVVFYESKTWFLTLRQECRLWVFENRMLRKVFVPKGDEGN